MRDLRRYIAIVICLAISGVAIWREMEMLAIVSFLAALSLIYVGLTRQIYVLLLEAARNTKQAKFGELEVVLKDGTVLPVNEIGNLPTWARILLSQLNTRQIGVLIQLAQSQEKENIVPGLRETYKDLRSRGLLEHDAEFMSTSKQVWLSKTGLELSILLLKKPGD
ncbi:MAG: hypothetical protein F6J97_01020 [Leptolyngbya sp. SIO4C1]|nr:hypothetical protein [Leptolyngbya sp. SIO4C1]